MPQASRRRAQRLAAAQLVSVPESLLLVLKAQPAAALVLPLEARLRASPPQEALPAAPQALALLSFG